MFNCRQGERSNIVSFASLVLGLSNGKETTHSLQKTAILGFGAFGHLIAERLRSRVIYPSPEAQAAALRLGLPVCALSDVAHCEWVVLAVPLSALRHVLTDLAKKPCARAHRS
jgi:prephenate dehydrogenase